MNFIVFVPDEHLARVLGIAPGSGVVGGQDQQGSTLIDYEGNLYGASNIVNFADRCYHAASRQEHGYPTVARAMVKTNSLLAVGIFDGTRVFVGEPEPLKEWLDVEQLKDELEVTARRHPTI